LLSDHVEPGARIDVLKCDIEGSETEVFKDCSSWIRRVRCMAVEVHNPYRAANLRDDLCRSHALIHDFSISSEGDRYQVVVVRFDHDD